MNGYKPCYRRKSELKCVEGTLGIDFGPDCVYNKQPCRHGLCMGNSETTTASAISGITSYSYPFTFASTSDSHAAFGGPSGRLVTWGNYHLDESPSGIKQLVSNDYAIAAITNEGALYAWGNSGGGGQFALQSTYSAGVLSLDDPSNQPGFARNTPLSWLRSYQCQDHQLNAQTIQYIENNLVSKKSYRFMRQKRICSHERQIRDCALGHTTVGGKMSSYAFEKKTDGLMNRPLLLSARPFSPTHILYS